MSGKKAKSDDSQQQRRDIKNIWIVSFFTLLSRFLGYARFILLIHFFSQMRWVSDALIFAFRIPNLFRNLLGEGALSSAFIPVFVKTREGEGIASVRDLSCQVASLLALLGGAITVLGSLFCLAWIYFLEPDDTRLNLALQLTAMFMVFMPLTCLAALFGGMLQGLRRFSLPAFLPVIINIGFLSGFAYVYLVSCQGDLRLIQPSAVFAIAIFVLAAGLFEVLLELPLLLVEGIVIRPTLIFNHPGLKTVLRGFAPTALGLGLVQVNAFFDSLIAGSISLTNPGSLTYLEIGLRFMQLPLGVFGVAIATVAFPGFASAATDLPLLRERLTRSIRMSAFFLLPLTGVLIAMADPIIRLTCQRPDLSFDHAAVYRSVLTLTLYSAGIFFYSLRQIFARVYYAMGDYSTPVRIGAMMVGVNLVLNLVLINCPDLFRVFFSGYFRYWNIPLNAFSSPNLAEAGLALATLITAVVDSCLLWLVLRRRLGHTASKEGEATNTFPLTLSRLLPLSLVLGVLTWLFRNSIPYTPEFLGQLSRLVVPAILATGSFYIIATVFSLPELGEFLPSFRRSSRPAADSDKPA
ncbi:MAG: murein biosynthesis integral membrane protein MurJ [Planctomycetota bacterium]|nr:murein biosynthesis integral membrane protein MurJ [Planctomycetota bacterium]